jgi:hypothetical protein
MSFHLGKPRLPSVEYYPNNIGNLTIGTPRSYAFLIYGRDERGIQAQILGILHKRGARIISQNGYVDEKTREFTLCISCDLGEVSVTPDDLVIELRRMKLVRNAMAICLKNRMFDGFLFPLTVLLSTRVVAVDSNLPFMIQDRLGTEEARTGLQDVGHDFALDVVRQIHDKLTSGYLEESIQENVRGYLKATGWGSFTWESETSFERVTVVDPPTYSGKAVGNYFLHGIASGLLEAFRKKKFALVEEVYNQDTRSLTLMLSEKRIEVKRLESEKRLPKTVEVKALEEVEKVIRSVELDEMEIESPPSAPIEQTKPVVLVQQSGMQEREIVAPAAAPRQEPQRIQLEIDQEEEKEIEVASIKPPKIEPPVITHEPAEKPPVIPEEKKPAHRVIEIKGIKEKAEPEEDEDEDDYNGLWFEQAIQEE